MRLKNPPADAGGAVGVLCLYRKESRLIYHIMKKTAIYIRVSSDRQVQEGDSIAAQRDALIKYVNDRPDLVLAGEYLDDGVSGQKDKRDELQRLLDDVRQDRIDLIIFTKLDRWFRSVRHYTATQEVLDRHSVTWTAIWESIYDTTTPQGRLIVNQMMSIAQFEAENTGQRIRQVQAYKVTQGEVISGSCPVGYSIKDKHLILTDTAAAVLDAFKTYSFTGSINETMTLTQGRGLPRTKAAFKNMLMNEKYTGSFRGNDTFCQPIVSRELFNDVQRKLSINVKQSQKQVYIFSGLLKCGECGCSLGGNTRRRNRNGHIAVLKQYRCPRHYQGGVSRCDNAKVISEHALEVYMWDNLRPLVHDLKLKYNVKEGSAPDLQKQLSAVRKKIDRLKELFINDLITLDEYKTDKERYEKELADISALNAPVCPDFNALDKILAEGVEKLYQDFTEAEKRYFWRSIIQDITMGIDRVYHVSFLSCTN